MFSWLKVTPDSESYYNNFHKKLSDEKTHSEKVKQFTEESRNVKCPDYPEKMNVEEVKFIIKMVMSELTELAQTVSDNPKDAIKLVESCLGVDVNMNYVKPKDDTELIAEQYDAFVDSWYYCLNAAAKKGVNLDRIFNIVHQANMNKKWKDGLFHKREDGKVIKPENWTEPDIVKEVRNQIEYGSWEKNY